MTQAAPPVGYAVDAGAAWTTDIDHDTTRYKTGDSAVLFKDTTPASDPHLYQDVATPCAAGDLFRISGWVNANRRNSGDNVQLYAAFYDGAGAGVSTVTVHEDVVAAVDTWEFKSGVVTAPAGAYGMRPIFGKNNVAFKCWWDSIFVEVMPMCFSAYLSADQEITSGETLICDAEERDFGSNYNNTTGVFTAPSSGVYSFSGTVKMLNMTAGRYALAGLSTTDATYWGSTSMAHADGDNVSASVVHPSIFLDAGDTAKLILVHNNTGTRDADGSGTAGYTYFAGAKVQ